MALFRLPRLCQLVASSSLTSLNTVCVRTDLVLPKVMDDAWVAAAQEAYDHVTADEEEVLVAVAGVGGPTNVFVTRGEGKTHGRIPSVASAAPRNGRKTGSFARPIRAGGARGWRRQRSAALELTPMMAPAGAVVREG